jgi:hypothetical protein
MLGWQVCIQLSQDGVALARSKLAFGYAFGHECWKLPRRQLSFLQRASQLLSFFVYNSSVANIVCCILRTSSDL